MRLGDPLAATTVLLGQRLALSPHHESKAQGALAEKDRIACFH